MRKTTGREPRVARERDVTRNLAHEGESAGGRERRAATRSDTQQQTRSATTTPSAARPRSSSELSLSALRAAELKEGIRAPADGRARARARARLAARGAPVAARTRGGAARAARDAAQAVLDDKLLVAGLAVAEGYDVDARACLALCRQAARDGFLLKAAIFQEAKRARAAAAAWAAAAPGRAAARLAARAGAEETREEREAAKDEDDEEEYACPHQTTRLHVASTFGHADRVRVLLTARAAVNARDRNGDTPLSSAAFIGHAAVVSVLLSAPGVDVNLQYVRGWSPLHGATQNGHVSVVCRQSAACTADRGRQFAHV